MADMTFSLPRLPAFAVPPLPNIADTELHTLTFTHKSNHTGRRTVAPMDMTQSEKIMDYEKLEHVGDAILGSVVTTLLHELFPQLQPGPATVLKGCLVSNQTLAQLASRYNMTDRLIAAPAALLTTRMQVKTRASVFEAYIAAVFYDFMISETPGAYAVDDVSDDTVSCAGATADNESVRDDITEAGAPDAPESISGDSIVSEMGTMTIKDFDGEDSDDGFHNHVTREAPEHLNGSAYPAESRLAPLGSLRPVPLRTRGEAYDYVERWLRPLMIPIAHFALEAVRSDAAAAAEVPSPLVADNEAILGAAGCLNQWLTKQTGTMPEYTATRDGARWRMDVHFTDSDGVEHSASAVRETQKMARNQAAYALCKKLNLDTTSI